MYKEIFKAFKIFVKYIRSRLEILLGTRKSLPLADILAVAPLFKASGANNRPGYQCDETLNCIAPTQLPTG